MMTMKSKTISLEISTSGQDEVVNITQQVKEEVERAKLKEGLVTVFARGSTAAITTLEFEPGLQADIKSFLGDLVPAGDWRHNQTWGDGNGHSHIKASLIGPSVTIPVAEGQPVLGTWQQVVFIDNDVRARSRSIFVQLIGEME